MYACAPPHSLSLPLSPLESALAYCKTRKTFVQSLWVYLLPVRLTAFHTLVPLTFQVNRFYSKKQEAILNKDWAAHHEASSCWGTCKVMAVVTLWLNISAGAFFPCSCGSQKVELHREVNHELLLHRCEAADHDDLWRLIGWRMRRSGLHYLHGTVYASDYVYHV